MQDVEAAVGDTSEATEETLTTLEHSTAAAPRPSTPPQAPNPSDSPTPAQTATPREEPLPQRPENEIDAKLTTAETASETVEDEGTLEAGEPIPELQTSADEAPVAVANADDAEDVAPPQGVEDLQVTRALGVFVDCKFG